MSENIKELISLLTEEEMEELKKKRIEKHGKDSGCCLGKGCSGECIKKILENRNN